MKNADKWFSIYIRIRDSDENGYIRCCTCSKAVHWKEADNCHYIDRKHQVLRYSEINCNAGCLSCNRFENGNIEKYKEFLISKYGSETTELLNQVKNRQFKVSKLYFAEIEMFYRNKATDLANLKRIAL